MQGPDQDVEASSSGSFEPTMPVPEPDQDVEESGSGQRSQADQELEDLRNQLKRERYHRRKAVNNLAQQKRKNLRLQRKNNSLERKMASIFNNDQIRALQVKSIRWGNASVKKGIKLRFAAGPTGYKAVQDMGIPMPSLRTLQRRMQHLKFEPGILGEVFEMLRLKAEGMNDMEKECTLTLDEMAISEGVELHMGTGRLFGDVTLPQHTGEATHACVFMLAGISTRWKQIVAYHYTGNSTKGSVYQPIIVAIVEAAASVGLHVTAVTCDMGSPNRAMWKAFGVTQEKPWIQHPVEAQQRLFFMPDVPHVIKNLKNALVRSNITLPQDVVEKEQLPLGTVSLDPVKDLVSYQESMPLKLAPKLTRAVVEPNHFQKMKVSSAMHIFSKTTSAALNYLVEEEQRPKTYLTTSWFLEVMDQWFDLMSSRRVSTALSHLKMENYKKAITFLQDSIHLFHGLKIGDGRWKPVQTGLIMATTAILEVHQDLLNRGHKFVLTSRFTQDCLENTFSCIRQRNPVPTPVEFHYALRAITVGQYLATVRTGNYFEDGSDHLVDFLDTTTAATSTATITHAASVRVDQLDNPTIQPDLTKTESNVLFHLAGYVVKGVMRGSSCMTCRHAVVAEDISSTDRHDDTLLQLKEYKKGILYRPSDEAFALTVKMEQLFRLKTGESLMKTSNARALLQEEAKDLHSNLPSCHDLKNKIINKYIMLRLRIAAKTIRVSRQNKNKNKGYLGSKTQAKKARKIMPAVKPSTSTTRPTTTARPLSTTLLVAMEVFGLSTQSLSRTFDPPPLPTPVSISSSRCPPPLPPPVTCTGSLCPPPVLPSVTATGSALEYLHVFSEEIE